jgi:hypothetical protein
MVHPGVNVVGYEMSQSLLDDRRPQNIYTVAEQLAALLFMTVA